MFKALLLGVSGLLLSASAVADTVYLDLGIGYKLEEYGIINQGQFINDPWTARIELGYTKGPLSIGISHHSQWFRGFPIDDKEEYHKTELFIDYKIDWEL